MSDDGGQFQLCGNYDNIFFSSPDKTNKLLATQLIPVPRSPEKSINPQLVTFQKLLSSAAINTMENELFPHINMGDIGMAIYFIFDLTDTKSFLMQK